MGFFSRDDCVILLKRVPENNTVPHPKFCARSTENQLLLKRGSDVKNENHANNACTLLDFKTECRRKKKNGTTSM
jgi:hypothetical protein